MYSNRMDFRIFHRLVRREEKEMKWIIVFVVIFLILDFIFGQGSDDFLREEVKDNEKR